MQELPRPLAPPTWRDRVAELPKGWPVMAAAVVVVAVLAVGGTLVLTRSGVGGARGPDVALSLPRADADTAGSVPPDSPTTTAGELHVHAAGAVAQPGVVTVPGGARVTDVVAAAGGPAADADLDQINLAAPVSDGQRIYVPHKGETVVAASAPGGTSAAGDGIVNINDADETTLETLPGVGPATAKAIIDYRTQHGKFRAVDDLLNVRGIGPSKLSQIKPHARV